MDRDEESGLAALANDEGGPVDAGPGGAKGREDLGALRFRKKDPVAFGEPRRDVPLPFAAAHFGEELVAVLGVAEALRAGGARR